jgi:hypothetical protein
MLGAATKAKILMLAPLVATIGMTSTIIQAGAIVVKVLA